MATQIDGPRVKAKSGQTKQLVVFLHGYGADGNDLIEIGRQWRGLLPDADFVAPHAPERCAMSPTGSSGFRSPCAIPMSAGTGRSPRERHRRLPRRRAREPRPRRQRAGARGRGFSRGRCWGCMQGCAAKGRHAPISRLFRPARHPLSRGRARPHGRSAPAARDPSGTRRGGSDDPGRRAAHLHGPFGEAGLTAQWHLSPGLGHGIDNAGLLHGGCFWRRALGSRWISSAPRRRRANPLASAQRPYVPTPWLGKT